MNSCIRFYLLPVFAILLLSINSIAQPVIAPAKIQQSIAEVILVKYRSLPKLEGDGFYMLFLFGAGGSFHESKGIDLLPEGTIQFNALDKPGNYNVILFAYKNINDNKPTKLTSTNIKIVSSQSTPVLKAEPVPAMQKSSSEIAAKRVSEFVAAERANTSYYLSTPKLPVNEPIPVSYLLPPVPSDSLYYISVSRREDNYAANSSNMLNAINGSAILKPIYQEGIYELRVYKSDKKTGRSSLAYRQPLAIGNIKKSFTGIYTCPEVEPSISGKRLPAGPSVLQVKQLVAQTLLEQKDAWIDDEDVCIEISQLQFRNSQPVTVPVNGSKKNISALAFPVVVRYKITVNDHFNSKTVAKEPGISRQFTFYKQSGIWQVLKAKS